MRRILLGSIVAGAFIVATAPVAVADDCSTLVQSPFDLVTDEFVIQDCIRTGQNWAWLIGGTVAATGVAVALFGLPGRPTVMRDLRAQRAAKDRPNTKDSRDSKEGDCQEALDRYNQLASEAQAIRDAFQRRTKDVMAVLQILDIRRQNARNALEWLAEDFLRIAKKSPLHAWDVWKWGTSRASAASISLPGLAALLTRLSGFVGGQRFTSSDDGAELPASAITLPASAVCALGATVSVTLASEGPEDVGAWLQADARIRESEVRLKVLKEQLEDRREKEEDVIKSFNRLTTQRRLLIAGYLADIYKSKADMKRLQLEAQEAKQRTKECGLPVGGWPSFPKSEDTTDPIGVDDLRRFGSGFGLTASSTE